MAHSEKEWMEAKHKCRLNDAEIRMARELGLNPRSLIKNIPSKSQQWKQPVGIWIQEMHEELKEKQRRTQMAKAARAARPDPNQGMRVDESQEDHRNKHRDEHQEKHLS